MFEKMVLSGAGRREHRLSKFFVGSSVAYLLLAGSALAVSICVSDPTLIGSEVGPKTRPVIFTQSSGGGRPPSGPRMPTPPRQNPYHVDSLDNIVDRARTDSKQPITLPHVGPLDPGAGYQPGWGNGAGPGDSSGPGFTPGSDVAGPPPQPPEPRRASHAVENPHPKDNAPLKVSQPVLQGKALFRKTPDYPILAKLNHKEGPVVVEVVISPEGRVESARAINGDPLLAPTAVAAALEWKFQPTYLGSVPVRVAGTLTFVFKLSQ